MPPGKDLLNAASSAVGDPAQQRGDSPLRAGQKAAVPQPCLFRMLGSGGSPAPCQACCRCAPGGPVPWHCPVCPFDPRDATPPGCNDEGQPPLPRALVPSQPPRLLAPASQLSGQDGIFASAEQSPDPENRRVCCLPGAKIHDVDLRLKRILKGAGKNPLIILHVGTNDTARFSLERIKGDYARLGKTLKEIEAQIIFSGILPVPREGQQRADRIVRIKSWLREWCYKEGFGMYGHWEAFGDRHRFSWDGLHLSSPHLSKQASPISNLELNVCQFTAQETDDAEWPEGVYYEGKKDGGVEEVNLSTTLGRLQRQQIKELCTSFAPIFSATPGWTERAYHSIDTGNAHPIRTPPYRESPHAQTAIQREIQDMLQMGIIRPSKSAWASPVVLVPKPDGEIRFCVDYRKLNAVTRPDNYPMPPAPPTVLGMGLAQLEEEDKNKRDVNLEHQ
ncbi:uncharacterized protein LOC128825399 [Malaclemys terrapin pileata]|uniref:uncharacterized protein LOC128825399 n=1 Tax=Malaclemys terrapin pileata TaxID=2991368 RepID=UPI0023A7AFEB|nr:uncharacterized protein LOC128825399 [Malaclemys terrapin pileata]